MALHLNSAPTHQSHIGMYFLCVSVGRGVICYLCGLGASKGVFLCSTVAAQGSVCLLDWWQTGVLFITWWRVTEDSLYEFMHVYDPVVEEVKRSFT